MTRRSATMAALPAAMTLLIAGSVLAQPAQAAVRDGTCGSGEFCYYYNSGEQGSVSDFTTSVSDYGTTQPGCYDFKSSGNGQGRCIKNDAASVWNRSTKTVRVYFNSGYSGSYQDFKAGAKGDLNSTLKNQNASHRFISSAPPVTECKTDGTDSKLPSTILVYRTASKTVERIGFKDYVKNVLPNEWSAGWPAESLKAGAMAVTSFGWYWALHSTSKINGHCFDVYDSTSSQVYRPGSATSSTNSAVDETWGTRMTRSGKIFQAHYCRDTRSCSAYTQGEWMSQYGSRDQARAGKSYSTILHYYYAGIILS